MYAAFFRNRFSHPPGAFLRPDLRENFCRKLPRVLPQWIQNMRPPLPRVFARHEMAGNPAEGSGIVASSLYKHHLKQAMRDNWMAGDFGKIAKGNVREAEAFVGRL